MAIVCSYSYTKKTNYRQILNDISEHFLVLFKQFGVGMGLELLELTFNEFAGWCDVLFSVMLEEYLALVAVVELWDLAEVFEEIVEEFHSD